MFDIVIPVGPKDQDIIQQQLEYTKKNVVGYRNIYLISSDNGLSIDQCITISENIFPFSLETVRLAHGELERNGWYLQQLLKLYAGFVIPDILDTYLVIDSDTYFLKPTSFLENGKCLYNFGYEYHQPYFQHMQSLDEQFQKKIDKSGICHHMIFQTKYIQEIFQIVETKHNDEFYNVFLKMVTEKSGSGASEYELYFNYVIAKHFEEIKIRPLHWMNTNKIIIDAGYDYLSLHYYMR
jgi:hypothetical protein